jgi:hypothetical protein
MCQLFFPAFRESRNQGIKKSRNQEIKKSRNQEIKKSRNQEGKGSPLDSIRLFSFFI